jgi:hypothetical protein
MNLMGVIQNGRGEEGGPAGPPYRGQCQDAPLLILPPNYLFETVDVRVKLAPVKSKILLPAIFIVVFGLSRIPGLMPVDFSVAYALAFCSGVFFNGRLGWWLPLTVIFATDIGLNFYYQDKLHVADVWSAANLANLVFNYAAYAVLICLGRCFKSQGSRTDPAGGGVFGAILSFLLLVGGGILGAALFYFITNTASWLFNPFHNPEYTKTLAGWITALTRGTTGYPPTWEFFRNTLLSGGLFTAFFCAAGKLTAESPADKTAGARAPEKENETETGPEEAKA